MLSGREKYISLILLYIISYLSIKISFLFTLLTCNPINTYIVTVAMLKSRIQGHIDIPVFVHASISNIHQNLTIRRCLVVERKDKLY